ncbi:MAG: tRNA adenosine(34) deaminase TadA [Actinobacteria bacterium]|nr:tRNA adenosine(34) deaminase TadA [Actinomycetota bacterium]
MHDSDFMKLALNEARAALVHGDVPIGAIVARNDDVIAGAHNEREFRGDPTAHAEILALQRASKKLGRWRLDDVTLYVTIEPCPMCAGAVVASRIPRLVYGAPDEKAGAAYSLYNIVQDPRLNHQCSVTAGVMAEESASLLQEFFRGRRKRIERL